MPPTPPPPVPPLPERMRAVVQHRYGGPEQLRVEQVPVPTIGPDEVLVEVAGAGVDRGTWHLMVGLPLMIRLASGLRGPKQPIPGLDVAGRVVASGEDVTRFEVGDQVFGIADGSFAELAAAKESKLSHRPANVPVDQAAVATVSGITALQALTDVGELGAGQQVLVMGASGGVGSYAVQIAKALGAHVTGVASTPKLDFVRSLGADEVVDYTSTDPLETTGTHDLIVDIGGRRRLRDLRRALGPAGTLVIVGGEGGGDWTGGFLGRLGRAMVWSPFIGQRLRGFVSEEHHRFVDRLAELMASGEVTPAIGGRYDLEHAGDAIADLAAGRIAGKALVEVRPDGI